jgi:hypothetical protein
MRVEILYLRMLQATNIYCDCVLLVYQNKNVEALIYVVNVCHFLSKNGASISK